MADDKNQWKIATCEDCKFCIAEHCRRFPPSVVTAYSPQPCYPRVTYVLKLSDARVETHQKACAEYKENY